MINAKDLKIGNYVRLNSGAVVPIQGGGIYAVAAGYLVVHPIELTPEILEKCEGFRKVYVTRFDFDFDNGYSVSWDKQDGFAFDCEDSEYCLRLKHIKYLHQLQNICYDLTGEELEINL